MASNKNSSLLQCTECHEELNLESKTLPCLHSFCRSCLDRDFKGETGRNGHCPECHEHLTLDQLSLAPFLVNSLRRLQLETTEWKCDFCSEDGIESIARNWCYDCQKLFCANCSRCHKKLHPQHNAKDLDEMDRDEAINAMTTDMCCLHQKNKDSYCERCNMCFCDTCYHKHSTGSPMCSSRPLSVKSEALKQKLQGPTLGKEMDDLKMSLRRQIERTRNYTEEINADCNSKCKKLWEDFAEMMYNAKQKTNELCKDMRRITAEQVKRWRHFLEGNENTLKQLEIWRLNLQHLLSGSQQDVDVVCGLRMLGSKLSSRLQNPVGQEEKCQLNVTFPNWWLQVLKQFKTEKIGSVSLAVKKLSSANNLVIDKEWNPSGSNLYIRSIHASKEDNHVFLCNYTNDSIMEFSEGGELVGECLLNSPPFDMCSISPDILVVVAGYGYYGNKKLIFLERIKIPPFLKIKNIIDTEKTFLSLCQRNETIFVCDNYLQIESFTKEGKKIKTIKTGELGGHYSPRIRADPYGNVWLLTRIDSSELFCLNRNREEIRSMKIEEEISDIFVAEFGDLYFCNHEGIFSFYPEKKILYKFNKRSEVNPQIVVLNNKIFASLRIGGKYLIQIFKIFY